MTLSAQMASSRLFFIEARSEERSIYSTAESAHGQS
jgi:hypothetical protein